VRTGSFLWTQSEILTSELGSRKLAEEEMMKSSIGLLISATLVASTAVAEPPAPPPATSISPPISSVSPEIVPSEAGLPVKARAAAGKTVDGLTVVAPAVGKPCGSRDRECVALVVAELKRRYPEELKRFCFQRQMRAMRSEVVNEQLLEGLGGGAPPVPTAFGVNSALKTACAEEKK
jgi:hypothetical protein